MTFDSRRTPVFACGGMVAASQPLAVSAGLSTLDKGGTAGDAAVAVAAALAVTEPCSTGLGGDAFALYYDSVTKRVHALNGSGRCPGSLTVESLAKEGITEELPLFHAYTVTTPGAFAAWCDLHRRFGRLSFGDLLDPAVRLATDGHPVGPVTAWLWKQGEAQLGNSRGGAELLMPGGRAPRAGEKRSNPGLAKTLEILAEKGRDAYYQGPIGEAVVKAVQEHGGKLSMEDLAAHTSTWDEAVSTVFSGLRIWECPPNGQGLAALIALNILTEQGIDGQDGIHPDAERLHVMIEAMRLAFADAHRYIADPAFAEIPLSGLLDSGYARERAALIRPGEALRGLQHGTPPASSETVYFCVVDREGNACSMVNSNYMGFGTGIVPDGLGFSLQNRGHNFSLDPNHPNALAPGKRPYHTIIPALATRESDGSLYGPFGVMGGFMQPQGHMQVAAGLALDGLGPQGSLDRPRFCIDNGARGGDVLLEEGISEGTFRELERMGHPVRKVSGFERDIFGRGQIIIRDSESGVLAGGSDPRADGCAMGLP